MFQPAMFTVFLFFFSHSSRLIDGFIVRLIYEIYHEYVLLLTTTQVLLRGMRTLEEKARGRYDDKKVVNIIEQFVYVYVRTYNRVQQAEPIAQMLRDLQYRLGLLIMYVVSMISKNVTSFSTFHTQLLGNLALFCIYQK